MKLIDKDALLVEIERRMSENEKKQSLPQFFGMLDEDLGLTDFINSLEVKEVDLDFQRFAKEMDAVFDLPSSETENTEEEPLNWEYAIAKHFFELGMQVGKPITAADRGMAEEIIINLKRVEQDYRINLTKEMEWLRNKVKKGE